jgi:hypothetical protein
MPAHLLDDGKNGASGSAQRRTFLIVQWSERPLIFPDQSSPHRIEFLISERCPKMPFVERIRVEPVLPRMASLPPPNISTNTSNRCEPLRSLWLDSNGLLAQRSSVLTYQARPKYRKLKVM